MEEDSRRRVSLRETRQCLWPDTGKARLACAGFGDEGKEPSAKKGMWLPEAEKGKETDLVLVLVS